MSPTQQSRPSNSHGDSSIPESISTLYTLAGWLTDYAGKSGPRKCSLCLTAREKFWHVFQRTNLYDEARHVFKTDEHGICATRHGRACRHVKLMPGPMPALNSRTKRLVRGKCCSCHVTSAFVFGLICKISRSHN